MYIHVGTKKLSLCSPVEVIDTFEGAHTSVPVTVRRAKKKVGVSQGQLTILTSFLCCIAKVFICNIQRESVLEKARRG